jgi:hypothetical protein
MGKKGYVIPFRRVEVIWDDATSNSDSWVEIDDIVKPERVNTSGWLVKEEETYVTVAASVSADGEGSDVVGNTMTVPRGMIVSIKDISIARSKPRHKIHPQPGAEEVYREQSKG